MKSNIIIWANHYREYLIEYYDNLVAYFEINKDTPPEYKDFVLFVYLNTSKRYCPTKKMLIAPVY